MPLLYGVRMGFELPQLNEARWDAILACLPPPRRSTRTAARVVFETMLNVLWYGVPVRSMRQPKFASASVVSASLWTWAESGALQQAWGLYLRSNSALALRHWGLVFTHYEQSWRFRNEAPKHAGKVHSLWFHVLSQGLNRELLRRKRVRN